MSNRNEMLRRRVQAMLPDLEIRQLELNDEGLANDVVVVNGELVFRFPKTEAAATVLETESQILSLVQPHLSLPVPAPIHSGRDCMVYRLLPGQPLTRRLLLSLDDRIRSHVARQLGSFLRDLHALDTASLDGWEVPFTRAPVTRERWLDLRDRIQANVYPLLLHHQVVWADHLFAQALDDPAFFDYELALIHGDLASYHILFEPDAGAVTGIIDFGVAGLGDPALDIGSLITAYGERFVEEMAPGYPGLGACLPRARFYAQSIELQWVLLGVETGETFWFTAHIGGARDIRA
ncbi:MAG: phosphotransferase [Anaerolineae bacterium]|nr:phosphotransferase [Anaerolineae bacterium]